MIPSIYPNLTFADFGAFISVWKNKDKEFNNEACKHFGFKYAQTYSMGRAGLFHILEAHNIKNKKIIVTAYTCCVVTEAIIQSGNTLFFIDTNENSFNSTVLEQHITTLGDELGAVLITNIFGINAKKNYDFISKTKK